MVASAGSSEPILIIAGFEARTAGPRNCGVQEVPAIGQKVRPPVVRSPGRRIEGRDDGRHPAAARHALESGAAATLMARTGSRCRGSNFRRARPARHTASVGGPPAIWTFFSLPSAKNPMNRLSGDQNGKVPPSVPGIGLAASARDRSQPDLITGPGAGDERDVPAIRRHRHLCGDARSARRRTSKRRVLRRRDRELHRGRGGCDSPARRRATTAMAITITPTSERASGRPRQHALPGRPDRVHDGGHRLRPAHRQQFLDLEPRVADVAHPRLGILSQAAGQQPAKSHGRRRRQGAPVGLLQSRPPPA